MDNNAVEPLADGITPSRLADELRVGPKRLREFLRTEFPRSAEEHGDDWTLTSEQVATVREHFGAASSPTHGNSKWREFASLAAETLAAGLVNLDAGERDYKRAVAERVRAAREACVNGDQDWPEKLFAALGSSSNLIYHLTLVRFKAVVESDPLGARSRLLDLWAQEGGGNSLTDFTSYLDEAHSRVSPGGVLELASTLLMAVADAAPFKSRAVARFAERVGASVPAESHAVDARWRSFLQLMDQASTALKAEGVAVRDRLDAQSIMWVMSEWAVKDIAQGTLAERIKQWRGEDVTYERHNRIDKGSEDAAWRVLRAGLLQEQSPLTGGPSAWNAPNAHELIKRIFDNAFEGSDRSFSEKLRIQLDEADVEVVQLVAEIQLIRQLVTQGTGIAGATKSLALCSEIADQSWTMPDWLRDAFTGHVFGGGMAFNQGQWLHIVQTARFAVDWFESSVEERSALLSDPWALVDFLEESGGSEAAEKHMRMVLAYVAWPNYFHPIISSAQIKQIREAFPKEVPVPSGNRNADVQRDLYAIDQVLEKRHGGPVNFYVSPYVEYWRDPVLPPPPPPPPPGPAFAEVATGIADALHMDKEALARIGRVLEQRRQVVFYGPPGTGKTYIARQLAAALAGEDSEDAVRLVQFHPSYSYEDFFEGFRPVAVEGGTGFSLQAGPLRKLAASAKDNPDQPHFLIIDEMNRGNLAKVFGELYFLLEYRDQEVYLQYSPQVPFTLPDNLYVIGTMNTTDRSVGLVDAAIRRRFAFIEFHPDVSPVEGVLARYLAVKNLPKDMSVLLDRLNSRIDDRDLRVGPSYLMRPQAYEPHGLEDVWDYDILPLLYEHFHGRKDAAEVRREFGLDALRSTPAVPEE